MVTKPVVSSKASYMSRQRVHSYLDSKGVDQAIPSKTLKFIDQHLGGRFGPTVTRLHEHATMRMERFLQNIENETKETLLRGQSMTPEAPYTYKKYKQQMQRSPARNNMLELVNYEPHDLGNQGHEQQNIGALSKFCCTTEMEDSDERVPSSSNI